MEIEMSDELHRAMRDDDLGRDDIAAQADYERRILSALDEPAPKVTEVNAAAERAEIAALVALARHSIPTDVQDLLVRGDPMRSIPPRALSKAILAALEAQEPRT